MPLERTGSMWIHLNDVTLGGVPIKCLESKGCDA